MAVVPGSERTAEGRNGFKENAREVREDVERGRSELRAIGARGREITEDFQELARLEAELAKAEMQENRRALARGSVNGAMAGVFAFWLLGFLGGAMTLGLMEIWPAWAAALATAGVFLLLAAITALMARSQFQKFSPTPRRTIESIREDIAWLRRLTKRNAGSANSELSSSRS